MTLKRRSLLGALGLLAVIATPVLAAGLWPNLPIVGGAAFCSSTNQAGVPGTAPVCTTTSPAGPSAVTGLETVPADTHRASGSPPQTVNLTMASFNALPFTYATLGPSTATNSLSAGPLDGGIVIDGSAALSPTTVTLPASPIDGQQFALSSTQNIATLTVAVASGSGQTVKNSPTALTVSTVAPYGYRWKFRQSNTTWYRLQ